MTTDPRCSLCSGQLKLERNVRIHPINNQRFALAWVCIQCSTAYPIALGGGGVLRRAFPLFQRGERLR